MRVVLIVALLFASSRPLAALNLTEAAEFWRSDVALTCQGYPSKQDCDDGDSVIFNGLLCMAGEELGCETVRASQDESGRFWRSPRRNPGNLGQDKSFSRDQTLGVLLYLAKTRDRDAAQRWMDWIQNNRFCRLKNPVNGGCSLWGYRVCRDHDKEICELRPATWALVKRVWDYLELPTTSPMRRNASMDVSDLEILGAAQAKPGYEMHLKAVASFIRLSIGSSVGKSRQIVDNIFARQPGNPFLQLLAQGPSERVAERVLQLCPKPGTPLDFRRFQWSWERDTAGEAWRESMGWDCIFLARLIEAFPSFTEEAIDEDPFEQDETEGEFSAWSEDEAPYIP